jgi:hypothetical protein
MYSTLYVTPHFYLSVTVIDAVNLRACKRHNCYNFILSCVAVVLRDCEPPDQSLRLAPFTPLCLRFLWRAVNNSKVAGHLASVVMPSCPCLSDSWRLFRPHQLYDFPFVQHTPTTHVGLSVPRTYANNTRDRQSVAGFSLRRF